MMGQPRIMYRIAEDGLLPPLFAQVSSTTQVPTAGILFNGGIVGILSCFFNLDALANTISLLVLLVFTFVNAAVIILRHRSCHLQNHHHHNNHHHLPIESLSVDSNVSE